MKYRHLIIFFLFYEILIGEIKFNRDIRPILADRCFHCHGPDKNKRKANLRLDIAKGLQNPFKLRNGSFTLKPGSLNESELWHRITTKNTEEVMPPADSHKQSLNSEHKKLIKKWILKGAKYEEFWAFSKIKKPEIPKFNKSSWYDRPIDAFVMRKLESSNLMPKHETDKRTLIRRVTMDLTGLPPSRKEIHSFLSDDTPNSYENLVDRLLKKPQYGEHMTKYWLDLVRFADSNGIHHDHYRNMTPYRDWVIRSFNENLPYDDFIKYQLAGDLYENPSIDQLIASGFHRLHMIIDTGTRLPEESFVRNVIDRVTSVGTAFMGLTLECAVCHDHKYDPIKMKDFYSLFAFFNNIDVAPETDASDGPHFKRGIQVPFINLTTNEQEKQLDKLNSKLLNLKKRASEVRNIMTGSSPSFWQKERNNIENAQKELSEIKSNFLLGIPAAMIMQERSEVRPTHILIGGSYESPGKEVSRSTPSFLPPMKTSNTIATRMELANWFIDKNNPLTSRVTVNRFWQQLMGVGIVKTSEDLGAQGEWPSHPDLLEYLSWKFLESGWNVKAIIKEIVMSKTYMQSSDAPPSEFFNDPENRLLSRASRYRFDSEVIRDQILATSGLLNFKLFGKSVKPPQPKGIWEAVVLPSTYPNRYVPDVGNDIFRRSLYTFWKRSIPHPQMTILNAPTREFCVSRRERTNTPLQALLLMNEPEYMKAARNLALKIVNLKLKEPITFTYETITSQIPDDTELRFLKDALIDLEKEYNSYPNLAKELTEGLDIPSTLNPKIAAWTLLINSIYNLDITKTRQ